jgi:hypothetical protein
MGDGSKTPMVAFNGCLTPNVNKPMIRALCPMTPLN